MNLSAHGHFSLELSGNILVVDAVGPFNDKVVEKYYDDIQDLIAEIEHQAWGSLVIYRGNGIFTPEAETSLIDITKKRMERGMVANATVFLDSVHADLQQMQLRRIYNTCRLPFYVFSDKSTAKGWLADFIEQQ